MDLEWLMILWELVTSPHFCNDFEPSKVYTLLPLDKTLTIANKLLLSLRNLDSYNNNRQAMTSNDFLDKIEVRSLNG
jgi:hypothetical protein